MGAWGFRPLVTAWEMTAWRFSFSSSISRRCSATSASIFAVSRSRNAAMAICSASGGNGNVDVCEARRLEAFASRRCSTSRLDRSRRSRSLAKRMYRRSRSMTSLRRDQHRRDMVTTSSIAVDQRCTDCAKLRRFSRIDIAVDAERRASIRRRLVATVERVAHCERLAFERSVIRRSRTRSRRRCTARCSPSRCLVRCRTAFESRDVPMLRHLAQPLHAAVLVLRVSREAHFDSPPIIVRMRSVTTFKFGVDLGQRRAAA